MSKSWFGVFAAIALASACSSENKPPPRAAVDPVVNQSPQSPPAVSSPPRHDTTALKVSQDIRSACALPEPQTYFAYNSSRVRHQDSTFLEKLTQCLTTGPLAKRQIRLVGHADPRGSDEYNYALAHSRAKSVKLAMVGLGFPSQQVQTESRGKREALGSNEAGWAKDRKVEVSLGQ